MDENDVENETVSTTRKPLEAIKASHISSKANRAPRQSIGGDFVDISEVKRLKVIVQEKDKKVAYLEQQLLASQTQIEQLQTFSEKYKRQEREAKRALFQHESTARRQSVALKHANDKLHGYVLKDEAKLRRSKMEKQELEEELCRIEESYEQQLANAYETLRNERQEHDEQINKNTAEYSAQMHKQMQLFQTRIGEQAEEYSAQLLQFSGVISQLESQSSELALENRYLKSREEDREQELKNFTELCESLKQEIASVKASNSTFAKQLKRRSDDLSAEIAKTQRLAQTIENLNERLRNAEKSGFEIEASLAETTQSSEYLVQLLRSEISSKDDQIQKLLGELKHTKEDVMLQTTSMSALTNELRILKDAQTTLKSLCDKFKGQLDLTRDELHNTRLSLQQSTSNSSSLEAELIKSKSKVVELESILGNVNTELQTKTSEANDLTVARDELAHQLNTLDENYRKACAEAQEQSLIIARISKEITDVVASLHQAQREHVEALAHVQNKYDIAAVELRAVNDQREQDKTVMEAFRNRLRETQQTLNASLEETQQLKADKTDLLAQLDASHQELACTNARIASLNSNIMVLSTSQSLAQDEISRLGIRLEESAKTVQSLQTEAAALQQQLVEKDNEREGIIASRDSLQSLCGEQKQQIEEAANAEKELSIEVATLSACLQEVKSARDSLLVQLQEVEARLASTEVMCSTLTAEKQGLCDVNTRLENELSDARAEVAMLNLANSSASARIQDQEAQLDDCRNQLSDLTAQMAAASEALAMEQKERAALEVELVNLQEKSATLQGSLETARSEVDRLQSELSLTATQLTAQTAALESDLEERKTAIVALNEMLEDSKNTITALTQRSQLTENELASLKVYHSAAAEQLATATQEKDLLAVELKASQEQVESLQKRANELEILADTVEERVEAERIAQSDVISALESQIKEEQSKIEELAQSVHAKDVEIESMKANLEAAKEKYEELKQQGRTQEDIEALALMGFLPDETIQTLCGKLKTVQSENAKLSLENANLLGHANSKQKIHYVTDLKKQINDLLEENQRLRDMLRNATLAATSAMPAQAAALQFRGKDKKESSSRDSILPTAGKKNA